MILNLMNFQVLIYFDNTHVINIHVKLIYINFKIQF